MSYLPGDPIQKNQLILDLISNRQEAISGNIANMDTPNYVRKDIEFSQYLNTMPGSLETRLSQKLGPSGVIEAREQTLSAEDELAIMQKNSMLYGVAARNLSSTITKMKTAINVAS
ncbi:MAG: flagellar basal body protein [Candidatus Gastranaerophilales bacterium]|nr:flagellar basal body protein [Candidatus Gastranaerophilales bacterium]